MQGIKIIQKLFNKRIKKATEESIALLSQSSERYKNEVSEQLKTLNDEAGPKVFLGTNQWQQSVIMPMSNMMSHGLVLGASGAGKSYFALSIMSQLLSLASLLSSQPIAFGLLDAKGELFEKSLAYLYAHLYQLKPEDRALVKEKIFVNDFSSSTLITPYNILQSREYISDEIMVANRIDMISEQFSGLSELSVRMKVILKYLFLLLAEFRLPLPFFERLCTDQLLLSRLVEHSQNPQIKDYFRSRFSDESKSTLLALRQRIDALLISEGVRLSLSASSAPDFTTLQDQGAIILINTAGRSITRGISELLQSLILSDIKQSVFRRTSPKQSFLWFFDEAQNLYKASANREHMVDLLTMSRSFGSFFVLLTQSLTSATRDQDILNSILGNVRWMVMLRSTLRDAALISPAIPLTGTLAKIRHNPFKPQEHLTESEELKARLNEVTRFPDRQALCWLKAYVAKSVRITTPSVPAPHEIAGCNEAKFEEFIASEQLGQGVSKPEIIKMLKAHERRLEKLFMPIGTNAVQGKAESSPRTKTGKSLVKALEEEYSRKRSKIE